MKKYSIISVVNKQYRKFAYVFIKSALEKLTLDKVHEICILDTGLSEHDRTQLSSLHSKVKLIKHGDEISSDTAWDKGWQDNVLHKTKFAYDYIKENKIPTCMIDIDSMFINDISDIMEHDGEIILCDRSDKWSGMPFIASFVGFLNVNQSLNFINEWRNTMNVTTEFQTKETPALNTMARTNTKYDLLGASHTIVGLYSNNLLNDQARILHFKGDVRSENMTLDESIMLRFNRFEKFKNIVMEYLQNV